MHRTLNESPLYPKLVPSLKIFTSLEDLLEKWHHAGFFRVLIRTGRSAVLPSPCHNLVAAAYQGHQPHHSFGSEPGRPGEDNAAHSHFQHGIVVPGSRSARSRSFGRKYHFLELNPPDCVPAATFLRKPGTNVCSPSVTQCNTKWPCINNTAAPHEISASDKHTCTHPWTHRVTRLWPFDHRAPINVSRLLYLPCIAVVL